MSDPFDDLLGSSAALIALKQRASRVATTDLATLLRGETGTGKEVLARCLHRASRRTGLFVAVDCAAMVGGIVQSELFGHTKGAFTGAVRPRDGLVHAARGGTLFLDEIAELSAQMQTRLLRLLENGTYRPVGADDERTADIRVLCATWKNLEVEVARGTFRADLYHRVAVVELDIPPLRERRGDVRTLAQHFLLEQAARHGRPAPHLTPALWRFLSRWSWPGNVRELRNVMSFLAVVPRGGLLDVPDLPARMRDAPRATSATTPSVRLDLPYMEARRHWLDTFQGLYIQGQLTAHDGNITAAAQSAHMDRRSIQRFLARRSQPNEPNDE